MTMWAARFAPRQLATWQQPSLRIARLRSPTVLGSCVFDPSHSSASRSFCDDSTEARVFSRYPHKYFDFKAFRQALKEKKQNLTEAEMREIRREYARPPPTGWTVLSFLEKMEFGDGAEDVADLYERWEDFVSQDPKDLLRIPDISREQRRRLSHFLVQFNHGLWPEVSPEEFQDRFKGKPLAREALPWTEEDDKALLELAEAYDVNFGDPWLYISWDMQRREVQVKERYLELVVKPRERATLCEFAITKASRPLLMNRKFRMMPPDLYIVPSAENFRLKETKFAVPAAFKKYRQDNIF